MGEPGVADAAELPEEERARIEWAGGPGSAEYGEISTPSSTTVLSWLRVTAEDVLVDLGSGAGRFVIHAAQTTRARRILGIEASPSRNRLATELLRHESADVRSRVELRQGDLCNLDAGDYTLAYVCSTCFHPRLLEAVSTTLLRLPRLRAVVSTRPLPGFAGKGFLPAGALSLATTWSGEVQAVCYQLM